MTATRHSASTMAFNSAVASEDAIRKLEDLASAQGDKFPRILLAICAYRDFSQLKAILARMTPLVGRLIAEIAVFDVFSEAEAQLAFDALWQHPAGEKLKYYRVPRRYGYGDNLKNCFDYAIEKNFNHILIIRGDGAYDPAYIAD